MYLIIPRAITKKVKKNYSQNPIQEAKWNSQKYLIIPKMPGKKKKRRNGADRKWISR
jgi:hypothetical protein